MTTGRRGCDTSLGWEGPESHGLPPPLPTSPFSLQAGMARAKAVFLLATDTSRPQADSETWSSKHLPGPRVPFPQRNLAQFHPEKEVQEEEEGRVTPSQPSFKGLCAPPPQVCLPWCCWGKVLMAAIQPLGAGASGACLCGPVWLVADGAQNSEGGREKAVGKPSPVLVISATPPCPHRGLLWALPTWSLIEPQGQRGHSAVW